MDALRQSGFLPLRWVFGLFFLLASLLCFISTSWAPPQMQADFIKLLAEDDYVRIVYSPADAGLEALDENAGQFSRAVPFDFHTIKVDFRGVGNTPDPDKIGFSLRRIDDTTLGIVFHPFDPNDYEMRVSLEGDNQAEAFNLFPQAPSIGFIKAISAETFEVGPNKNNPLQSEKALYSKTGSELKIVLNAQAVGQFVPHDSQGGNTASFDPNKVSNPPGQGADVQATGASSESNATCQLQIGTTAPFSALTWLFLILPWGALALRSKGN